MMIYLSGIVFALTIIGLARVLAFDRDRSFYPTLLMVIALVYILFAVMSGSVMAIIVESVIARAFILVAIIGAKYTIVLAVGLIAHGVFDFFMIFLSITPAFLPGGPAFVWRLM